jgi:hypothetical protein
VFLRQVSVSDQMPMYSGSLTSPKYSASYLCLYVIYDLKLCELYWTGKCGKASRKKRDAMGYSHSTWGEKEVNNITRSEAWDLARWIFVSASSHSSYPRRFIFTTNNPFSIYIFVHIMRTPDCFVFLCRLKKNKWRKCISCVYSWSWCGHEQLISIPIFLH